MPDTVREALEEMFFYIAPFYGRSVRLQSYSNDYWRGFEDAIARGFIEEQDCKVPYRREFRLLRKGHDFAMSIGLILSTNRRSKRVGQAQMEIPDNPVNINQPYQRCPKCLMKVDYDPREITHPTDFQVLRCPICDTEWPPEYYITYLNGIAVQYPAAKPLGIDDWKRPGDR